MYHVVPSATLKAPRGTTTTVRAGIEVATAAAALAEVKGNGNGNGDDANTTKDRKVWARTRTRPPVNNLSAKFVARPSHKMASVEVILDPHAHRSTSRSGSGSSSGGSCEPVERIEGFSTDAKEKASPATIRATTDAVHRANTTGRYAPVCDDRCLARTKTTSMQCSRAPGTRVSSRGKKVPSDFCTQHSKVVRVPLYYPAERTNSSCSDSSLPLLQPVDDVGDGASDYASVGWVSPRSPSGVFGDAADMPSPVRPRASAADDGAVPPFADLEASRIALTRVWRSLRDTQDKIKKELVRADGALFGARQAGLLLCGAEVEIKKDLDRARVALLAAKRLGAVSADNN
jgi:hypothetical protein